MGATPYSHREGFQAVQPEFKIKQREDRGALTHNRTAGLVLCGGVTWGSPSSQMVQLEWISPSLTPRSLHALALKYLCVFQTFCCPNIRKFMGWDCLGIMEGETWKCSQGEWRNFSPWPHFEPLPEPVKGLGLSPREWSHGPCVFFTGSCLTASFSAWKRKSIHDLGKVSFSFLLPPAFKRHC